MTARSAHPRLTPRQLNRATLARQLLPRSLTPKLLLADERGLAGAGFWAIGYERGLPGYTELIATFRAGAWRRRE